MKFQITFTADELAVVRAAIEEAERNADENFESEAADHYVDLLAHIEAATSTLELDEMQFAHLTLALASCDSPLYARFDKTVIV